jgi:UPF0755 protein
LKHAALSLAALALAGLTAAAVLGAVAAWGLARPVDPEGAAQLFVVEPGEPLGRVAARLGREGLVRPNGLSGPRSLVLWARLQGVDRDVKSGEYELSPAQSALSILRVIRLGEVKTWPVTLPDGLTIEEVADRLEATGIAEREALIERARDPGFARSQGVEAESLEGYLFPETYQFRRDTDPEAVLARMVEQFHAAWEPEDRAKLEASELTLHQVVTLASIVEKETGAAHERPRIAAVFHNRLERGMRLQSDPTVIYGLLRTRGEFDGNIRRRDLETDSPYNTYTRGGLPPGPISSASMASIRAVLTPEDVPYLYFVSQNDGTHYFSTTLREHVNAVNRYQKRPRRRPSPPSSQGPNES